MSKISNFLLITLCANILFMGQWLSGMAKKQETFESAFAAASQAASRRIDEIEGKMIMLRNIMNGPAREKGYFSSDEQHELQVKLEQGQKEAAQEEFDRLAKQKAAIEEMVLAIAKGMADLSSAINQ
jgi:5-formaminoimidazole-4-carboxamide-1-beta-D-ribofuranosyl 5'-monophosphate synthetase